MSRSDMVDYPLGASSLVERGTMSHINNTEIAVCSTALSLYTKLRAWSNRQVSVSTGRI